MALSKDRIHWGGDSQFEHERRDIEALLGALRDDPRVHAWPIQELPDPNRGRLHEIDLIVLGPHALYLCELKSYPGGSLEGDSHEWVWTRENGSRSTRPNPSRGINEKAKILKSALKRSDPKLERELWVESAVVINVGGKLDLSRLTGTGRFHTLFGIDEFRTLIEEGSVPEASILFPRSGGRWGAKEVLKALSRSDIRARSQILIGKWIQGRHLRDGLLWQEYEGTHSQLKDEKARLRIYRPKPDEPEAATIEDLTRIARREYDGLRAILDRRVLRVQEIDFTEHRQEPVLVFEPFEHAEPLWAIRQNPTLTPLHRAHLISEIAKAVHACHDAELLHRRIHPAAILARYRDGTNPVKARPEDLEIRLTDFQQAKRTDVSSHRTLTTRSVDEDDQARLFTAPEVLSGDVPHGSKAADVFSLGALAYWIVTGKKPAPDTTTLLRELREQRRLTPSLVLDEASPFDDAIQAATDVDPANRPDPLTFARWIDEAPRAKAPATFVTDPREAREGDRLEHDLEVLEELGRGASSRVLKVQEVVEGQEPSRPFALKVPLADGLDEDSAVTALEAEAQLLQKIRHPSVIALHDHRGGSLLRIDGRVCLALELLSPHTLGDRLREDALSLDRVERFGQDLLEALSHLEDERLTHRDIKPQNCAFTRPELKQRERLILLDFSLAHAATNSVELGTPAYRDPDLPTRGLWDPAADRYAAAMTLHEALLNRRPERDHDGRCTIDDEAFPAEVRSPLADFFRRSLDPDPSQRFANAEEMRRAWDQVFHASPSADAPSEPYRIPDDLEPTTRLADLITRPALLDAFFRAGAETALEATQLRRNRLVADVGRQTQEQFRALCEELTTRLATELEATKRLWPDADLRDEDLSKVGGRILNKNAVAFLRDQGITTTRELADTPIVALKEWAQEIDLKPTEIRRRLEEFNRAQEASAQAAPTTVEGWLRHLLGDKPFRKGSRQPAKKYRPLWPYLGLAQPLFHDDTVDRDLGLDRPPTSWPTTNEIAKATGKGAPEVSNRVGDLKSGWQVDPHREAFLKLLRDVVTDLGGVATLQTACEALCERDHELPAEDNLERVRRLREAAALFRIATCITDDEGETGIQRRTHNKRSKSAQDDNLPRTDLVAVSPEHLQFAVRLAKEADSLVAAASLPDLAVVRERFTKIAARVLPRDEDSTESGPEQRFDRLLQLAADVSANAACSKRLELYPRGLEPARAIRLARSTILQRAPSPTAIGNRPPLTHDSLQTLILERYPAAQPLPESRKELSKLLDPLDLVWWDGGVSTSTGEPLTGFVRKASEADRTVLSTQDRNASATISQTTLGETHTPSGSPSRAGSRSTPTSKPVRISDRIADIEEFRQKIRVASEQRHLRVLTCETEDYNDVIEALEQDFGLEAVSFDGRFFPRLDRLMSKHNIDPDLVVSTDREASLAGTATAVAGFSKLRALAETTAMDLLPEVLPDEAPADTVPKPRLLVDLGLIGRYELHKFLSALLSESESKSRAALLLLTPIDQGKAASIDGLPIPLHSSSQQLVVERKWVRAKRKDSQR